MNLECKINKLVIKNPVTVASGTAGYGEELSKFMDISKLGAIFAKGLSLKPRTGNPGNRVLETPSGMLNSIGLENVGVENFLKEKLPFLLRHKATVIPNVAGHTEEENVELAKILSQTEGIDAIELNVSCPNVKEGGIAFGTNLDVFTRLLEKVRKATECDLIVKLSPNVTDVTQFAVQAEKVGVDAISAINTFLGMYIDTKKKKPHFHNKVAGLSGPAIRPMAIRIIYQIFEKINIPIIGMGGIHTFNDMLEFLFAGSAIISIGTMNMVDPDLSVKLITQLDNYLTSEKCSMSDLIGIAHKQ